MNRTSIHERLIHARADLLLGLDVMRQVRQNLPDIVIFLWVGELGFNCNRDCLRGSECHPASLPHFSFF